MEAHKQIECRRPARDHRTGSAVITLPSPRAQALLDARACSVCERKGLLPHLVANGVELYWEHQVNGSARTGCSRYGRNAWAGAKPREGSLL